MRPDVWLSVSATTRAPRDGETHGVDYLFVTRDEFDSMVDRGELLEWAEFAGHRYGTPRGPVEERLTAGIAVLLEIELHGARQVSAAMPEARWSSSPPRPGTQLVRRLVGRGTEPADVVARRLDQARVELAAEAEFDATVVNASVEDSRRQLVALLQLRADPARLARDHRDGAPPPSPPPPDRKRHRDRSTVRPEGITHPPIDELLEATDSKYSLVIYASKRARQINAYYSQLGEGLLEYVGPLVETHVQEKPLSIALREINAGMLTAEPFDPEA